MAGRRVGLPGVALPEAVCSLVLWEVGLQGPGCGRSAQAKPELRFRLRLSLSPGHAHLCADDDEAVDALLRP